MGLPDLTPDLYDHLRRIARRIHADMGPATIQPTEVLHEAWAKLGDQRQYKDYGHFVATVAQTMRHILVSRARKRGALKRDGGARTTLSGVRALGPDPFDMLLVDEVLAALAATRSEDARVAELRIFGGMTVPEVARAMEVSESTVDRSWRRTRAFLIVRLQPAQ